MDWDLDVLVEDVSLRGRHFVVNRPLYHPLVYDDGTVDCSGLCYKESMALSRLPEHEQLAFIADYLRHPLRYAHRTTFINPSVYKDAADHQ